MRIKNLKSILFVIILISILVLPYFVFATTNPALDNLQRVGPEGGYAADTDEFSMSELIGTVVSSVLSLLGVIFIVLMLYGGYNWMTAAGDESKLERAKNTIRRAIIGLIILVSSYAIWNFIYYNFIAK
jgi:fumarate reductase subunit D